MSRFKCRGSNVGVQMPGFKCRDSNVGCSNVGVQMTGFKCQGFKFFGGLHVGGSNIRGQISPTHNIRPVLAVWDQ